MREILDNCTFNLFEDLDSMQLKPTVARNYVKHFFVEAKFDDYHAEMDDIVQS